MANNYNDSKSVFLVGLRASGKTYIGTLLAKKIGYTFYDTDFWVQKNQQKTIEYIVKTHGWSYFRDKENQVLYEMPTKNSVIATGGGIILNPTNGEYMQKQGICIFLDAPCTLLIERRKNDPLILQRPTFMEKSIESVEKEVLRLYNERHPIYTQFAHYTIDASEHSSKIIEKIITFIHAN